MTMGHYLMTEGQDETLAAYGKKIIPSSAASRPSASEAGR